MMVKVRVSANAKESRVVEVGDGSLEVKVDAKAVDGKANKRLIEILSDHYGVSKSRVKLVSGARSRDKVVDIP